MSGFNGGLPRFPKLPGTVYGQQGEARVDDGRGFLNRPEIRADE